MGIQTVDASGETYPLLRRTSLRNFLSDTQLRELDRSCRAGTRRPGSTLFRQGEPADGTYVVAEGTVELRARPPGRRVYRTVEVIGSGCTVGDEALFEEERYLTSARVLEQARLLHLSRPSFERLVDAQPAIVAGLLQCAGSCLLQTLRRSAILTQAPADVALKLLLGELASDRSKGNGRPEPIRITHAQLAGVLHLSRETVSRMLGNMAEKGSIELGRGVIRVRTD